MVSGFSVTTSINTEASFNMKAFSERVTSVLGETGIVSGKTLSAGYIFSLVSYECLRPTDHV